MKRIRKDKIDRLVALCQQAPGLSLIYQSGNHIRRIDEGVEQFDEIIETRPDSVVGTYDASVTADMIREDMETMPGFAKCS